MEANLNIMEGAQYKVRVQLKSEQGDVLCPGDYRVYGGAYCPGKVRVNCVGERTSEEWVLTLPGLTPGRVPWVWQVFAAERETGVEWLLAGGEIRVVPRCAAWSVAVDPGELGVEAVLDKSTMQVTAQLGESTAVIRQAASAARQSAEAARISASAAAESAEAAAQALEGVQREAQFTVDEEERLRRIAGQISVGDDGSFVVDDRLAVLPLGVKTARGADGYGLSVSADGGLQLWGTHFLQGDVHNDRTLKVLQDSLSLGSTDTAALGFDYANTVTFRTFPNDGSTANDNAGGVYRFEAWQWADDSHTSKVEMAVDVRKPNAGVLCDESLMNRAEVLAAIEENEKQFTEKEETILKRGVERDFLTRNHTHVFITDEDDSTCTLSSRPPLLDMEDEGNYTLAARLNKDVMKEWLGIGDSSSEPSSDSSSETTSDKWYIFSQYPVFSLFDADDKFTDGATYEISAFHTMTSATDVDPFRAILTSQIGPISLEQVKSILRKHSYTTYPIYATPVLQII